LSEENGNFLWRIPSISFETDSKLTQIGSNAFVRSFLKSIPRNVDFVGGSASLNVFNIAISIESGISPFVFQSDFILDSWNTRVIRYFGAKSSILILRHVQIISSSYFSNYKSFSSISFETNSELTRIEAGPAGRQIFPW
jgi:hypothetical protein